MTIDSSESASANALGVGDWVMAALCFVLPLILPVILAIYNFSRSRRQRGVLYVGVIGVQILLGLLVVMAR